MLYPFTFEPIFKERVWGGRMIERLYGKPLPPRKLIGESWELSDRPGDISVIANGPWAGRTLRWLMEHHERELLGGARSLGGRFPLLVKILDAREKLSLQVHPPAALAAALRGEPKTEMWYVAEADPGAEIYAGLRPGVTRASFEAGIRAGDVVDCFHRVPVRRGDAMFLPSGRVHALGAGLVVFEIQQNSDTTYRVSDWNRVGLDGKPRDLHIAESLQSIDFADFEPGLCGGGEGADGGTTARELVRDPLFSVVLRLLPGEALWRPDAGVMHILAVVSGRLGVESAAGSWWLDPGQFCLIPAAGGEVSLGSRGATSFLQARAG